MASVKKGELYTIQEVFNLADFNLAEKAAVDYNDDGVDRRKVKVGGLAFDDVSEVFRVPYEGADVLEITVDGEVDATLDVE